MEAKKGSNIKTSDLKGEGGQVKNPKTQVLDSGATRKGGISGPDLSGGGWTKSGK